jgi:hypothetical protein
MARSARGRKSQPAVAEAERGGAQRRRPSVRHAKSRTPWARLMKRPGDTTATFGARATDAHLTNSGHLTTFQAPLVETSTKMNDRAASPSGVRARPIKRDCGWERRSLDRATTRWRRNAPPGRKFGKAAYRVTTLTGGKPRREPQGRGRFTARTGMDAPRWPRAALIRFSRMSPRRYDADRKGQHIGDVSEAR